MYAELFGNLFGSAVQLEDWTSSWCVADFNTRPRDSARGSRAQRLHRGFFGSKARCKSLDRVPLALAVPNFSWRENLLQESIAETGNRRSNSGNFADINTCADDHIATGTWQAGAAPATSSLLIHSASQEAAIDAQDFSGHKAGRLRSEKHCSAG